MTNEEAIKQIQGMVVGAAWLSDYQLEALDMAIEALENNDKLVDDLQVCLDMYKKKKEALRKVNQMCDDSIIDREETYNTLCEAYPLLQKEYLQMVIDGIPSAGRDKGRTE